MNTKTEFRGILVGLLMLLTTLTVAAGEMPPGPGFFKWLFGGVVHYQEAGLNIFVEFIPPESVRKHFETRPDGYAWQDGTSIPVGSQVRLTVVPVVRRANPNDLKVSIALGRTDQSGWTEMKHYDTSWVKHTATLNMAPGIAGFWVYAHAGDDLDAVKPVLINLVSVESLLYDNEMELPGTPGSSTAPPAVVLPGRVTVTLHGPANYVSVYSNNQKVDRQLVNGTYTFTNIPPGEVRLGIGSGQWETMVLPNDDYLKDATGRNTVNKLLIPGGNVDFKLRQIGGGGQ